MMVGSDAAADIASEPASARARRAGVILEAGLFSGAMPEMKNFNGSPILVQTIVDIERRMENPH
jgi:hypothetical protein